MSYKEFRSLIEKGDEQGVTEFLEKEYLKNEKDQSHCDYEKYKILKDLIRHSKKDMIRKCIENGFPLNIDREDKSFDGTPLHVAVLSECPEIVQLLLDSGSCIYRTNGNDETPLLLSAIAGIDQITDLLLSHIEPKEYSNKEGFSHFHVACMRNHVELVHQFLISGTDIHQSVDREAQFWSGFTPLHFAVQYRSIDVVEFLVKSGANITVANGKDLTPLHLAFRKRNKKMIDILLSAQYFFQCDPDEDGLCHFDIACATNNVAIVKYFLQKQSFQLYRVIDEDDYYNDCDAIQFAIANDCIDVLDHLLIYDDNNLVNKRLQHILDNACNKGNREVFNLIINHFEKKMVSSQCRSSVGNCSININKPDSNSTNNSSHIQEQLERCDISQQTKLHAAALDYRDPNLVKSILTNHHPSIITMKDARGKTPLHLAFENDKMELVKQLLNEHLKIDDNPSDNNGLSHFHIACSTSYENVVENFLKKGADIDRPVNMDSPCWAGFTPLHFAIWFRQVEVAKLLLKKRANFAAKNASKLSPFDFAIPDVIKHSYRGSNRTVSFRNDRDGWGLVAEMLEMYKDRKIDGFEDRGITQLHVAATSINFHEIFARIFGSANADTINSRTVLKLPSFWDGRTPLHFAVWYSNEEAIEELLNHGADITMQSMGKQTAAHICEEELLCMGNIGSQLLCSPNNVSDKDGVSFFHLACKYKVTEAVEYYLKLGIDVNEPIHSEKGNEGKTPLHLAVEADDSKIVRLLLDHGANVNARDRYFATPMSLCKSEVVLKILLKYGADPQALDCCCRTALCNAVLQMKNFDFTVLKNGWNINELNGNLLEVIVPPYDNDKILSFMQHIKSLLLLDVPINADIQNWYFAKRAAHRITQNELSYNERCITELNLMKETKIDNRTTLYNLLHKSSNDMVAYIKNENFEKIVESEQNVRKCYPIYGYLVISQFKKGQKRTILLEQGKTSLSFIANQWMGDLAFESILRYLNDHEIQCLVDATLGRNILDIQLFKHFIKE